MTKTSDQHKTRTCVYYRRWQLSIPVMSTYLHFFTCSLLGYRQLFELYDVQIGAICLFLRIIKITTLEWLLIRLIPRDNNVLAFWKNQSRGSLSLQEIRYRKKMTFSQKWTKKNVSCLKEVLRKTYFPLITREIFRTLSDLNDCEVILVDRDLE